MEVVTLLTTYVTLASCADLVIEGNVVVVVFLPVEPVLAQGTQDDHFLEFSKIPRDVATNRTSLGASFVFHPLQTGQDGTDRGPLAGYEDCRVRHG